VSPKVNVFCAVSRSQIHGPLFFSENTITGHVLEHFHFPQLEVNSVIWQQDVVPPQYNITATVPESSNSGKIDRWGGGGGYILWPPRSPDLTPMDFSFWGFVKCNVYTAPMPVDFLKLRGRTVNILSACKVLKC
jgi:hypothetical protein